jgi:hypothetical protein
LNLNLKIQQLAVSMHPVEIKAPPEDLYLAQVQPAHPSLQEDLYLAQVQPADLSFHEPQHLAQVQPAHPSLYQHHLVQPAKPPPQLVQPQAVPKWPPSEKFVKSFRPLKKA